MKRMLPLLIGLALGFAVARRTTALRGGAQQTPPAGGAGPSWGRPGRAGSPGHGQPPSGEPPLGVAPGAHAQGPTQIPKAGWVELLKRTKDEVRRDNVALLSAGVALYALLALVPTMVAVVSIYGIFSDPAEVQRQVSDLLAAAPSDVRSVIEEQLTEITLSSSGGLGVTALGSIGLALWSSSSGMKHLVAAVNAAYDEDETRGFLKLRGLALGLTAGAIVFVVVAFSALAVLPALLADTALGRPARIAVSVGRFPVLFVALLAGLAVLYRHAPNREDPRWSWTAPGTITAGVLWIVASVAFSIYTARFGQLGAGIAGASSIIVLMLWLAISAAAVIIGAEMNAEAELQTAQDTTTGEPEPMGMRGAEVADRVVTGS